MHMHSKTSSCWEVGVWSVSKKSSDVGCSLQFWVLSYVSLLRAACCYYLCFQHCTLKQFLGAAQRSELGRRAFCTHQWKHKSRCFHVRTDLICRNVAGCNVLSFWKWGMALTGRNFVLYVAVVPRATHSYCCCRGVSSNEHNWML
jgi:hypothetical protein